LIILCKKDSKKIIDIGTFTVHIALTNLLSAYNFEFFSVSHAIYLFIPKHTVTQCVERVGQVRANLGVHQLTLQYNVF